MKILRRVKKIFMSIVGITFVMHGQAKAGAQKDTAQPAEPAKDERTESNFSKEALIDSLKEMNRDPKKVNFISAMCYDMAASPNEITFQCEICGFDAVYATDSEQGRLTQQLPYIKRILAETPYKIKVDSSGLCPVCGKGKDQVLVMNVNCFDCGKPFSWQVKNENDMEMLKWLRLKPPIKEIDLGQAVDRDLDEKEKAARVKSITEYITARVFCPECRKKLKFE